jgi:hypothetical protein
MSGRRIEDKGGYPGSSDQMMSSGNRLKHYKSAEGSGHIGTEYDDTTERVESVQKAGDGKIKGHHMKPGHRY